VLVLLDTVRADHLGAYGYARDTSPRLDALAAQGVVFESAISQAPWTAASIASLFTGLHPSAHGLDEGPRWQPGAGGEGLPFTTQKILAPANRTLAERLKAAGYHTAAFVSNTYVHASFGFAQGFDVYDDEHGDYSNDVFGAKRRGAETNARVLRWLAGPPAEPFFLFLHYNDAHWPYDPPPPYGEAWTQDYRGEITPEKSGRLVERRGRPVHGLDAEDLRYLIGLYDGEIRYADDRMGEILDRIAALELRRPLVTVVTSDHGEEFLEHGSASHGYTLFEEAIRVPLVMHAPGLLAPARVRQQVRSIDVLPTLLELIGLAPGDDVQGRSLVPLMQGRGEGWPAYAFSEATLAHGPAGRLEAVRSGEGGKLILRSGARLDTGEAPRGLRFELGDDPAELRNLPAPADAAQEGALLEALAAWRAENQAIRARREPADGSGEIVVEPEILERLRELGYVD
jgi:arylsulfatase